MFRSPPPIVPGVVTSVMKHINDRSSLNVFGDGLTLLLVLVLEFIPRLFLLVSKIVKS
jgi:hypothetical protein